VRASAENRTMPIRSVDSSTFIAPLSPSSSTARARAKTAHDATSPHGFRETLRATVTRIADGDRDLAAIVTRGPRSAPIDSGELLRVQASVYRTTQELDLVGRLVDKATQAVKTTLQSQS